MRWKGTWPGKQFAWVPCWRVLPLPNVYSNLKGKWFCQACSGPETMISLKLVDMCIIATKLSWFNILDKLCFKVGTSNKVGPVNTSPMFWARYKQISKLMLNFLYFCMGESDVWSFSELVLRIKLVFLFPRHDIIMSKVKIAKNAGRWRCNWHRMHAFLLERGRDEWIIRFLVYLVNNPPDLQIDKEKNEWILEGLLRNAVGLYFCFLPFCKHRLRFLLQMGNPLRSILKCTINAFI